MRVMLINPATRKNIDPLSVPLGLLSIGTCLKQHHHEVMIFESGYKNNNFKRDLMKFSPDIIGVSVISGKAVIDALDLSKLAKTLGIIVVWGGFLPSVLTDLVLKTGCVDIVSIGEGEQTWVDLADAIATHRNIETVDGLAFIRNEQIFMTPERALSDLSKIPPIDFRLTDISKYFYSYYSCKRAINLYASKGCFGHCTFCYNARFNCSSHRIRPVEHVLQEIHFLFEHFSVDGIIFNDDLMFANSDEMYRFCSAFRQAKIPITWGCFGRIGQFNKDDLKYMYSSGCRWLFFGIESGSKTMLRTIKKGIDYEKIEQTYKDCAEIGIVARAGFIIGFPGETEEQLKDTIKLALKICTSQISFYYYSLVPDSEAYCKLIEEHKINRSDDLLCFAGKQPFDKLVNFSDIADVDLKVVYSYFLLFSRGTMPKKESKSWRGITTDFILITLKAFSFAKMFYSVWSILKAFFYLLLHPRIRKKYSLSLFR